jgi:hypothetical protein
MLWLYSLCYILGVPDLGDCVASCWGLPDGDYQSCYGCTVYATCAGGVLYDNRPCETNYVWDDITKDCLYYSTICGTGTSFGTV